MRDRAGRLLLGRGQLHSVPFAQRHASGSPAVQKRATSLLASTALLFHCVDNALFVARSKQFSVQVHGAGFALARPGQADLLTVDLVGSLPAQLTGEQRHGDAVVNYYHGNDASQWRSGVPVWERVRAASVRRHRYGVLHINRRARL